MVNINTDITEQLLYFKTEDNMLRIPVQFWRTDLFYFILFLGFFFFAGGGGKLVGVEKVLLFIFYLPTNDILGQKEW